MEILEGATAYVVDDDEAVRDSMRVLLESYGMSVEDYPSACAFLKAGPRGLTLSCLLLDLHMPGMGGIEVLEQLRARGDRIPAIVITGKGDLASRSRVVGAGALQMLEKPVNEDVLAQAIAAALRSSAAV
ncbi:response regulator [Parvibaculum sp.]|uniref:response regulator n=1 Tax=Parvibaculum sp. TaxID=2024848 RepID=UPI000C8A3C89|nr:response regulator [Parvibaculum sp.]MAB14810.1 hypothetical protein [Parvibaculum sp.]